MSIPWGLIPTLPSYGEHVPEDQAEEQLSMYGPVKRTALYAQRVENCYSNTILKRICAVVGSNATYLCIDHQLDIENGRHQKVPQKRNLSSVLVRNRKGKQFLLNHEKLSADHILQFTYYMYSMCMVCFYFVSENFCVFSDNILCITVKYI